MNKRGLIIEYINFVYRFEMRTNFLKYNAYFRFIKNECEYLIQTINNSEHFRSSIKACNYLKSITNYNIHLCIKYYNISVEYKYLIFNLFMNVNDNDSIIK